MRSPSRSYNPREELPASGTALALVIDNGWASASDWDQRVATAERLIADADSNGVPVVIAFTAEKPNAEIGPFDAASRARPAARRQAASGADRPDRRSMPASPQPSRNLPGASVAVLSDGLAAEGDQQAFATLLAKARRASSGRSPTGSTWSA